MKNFKNIGRELILSVLSILILFVVLEVGMRIWINHFASDRRFVKYASLKQLQKKYKHIKPKYTPHRYLGHYPTPDYTEGENKHNSLGYRSDEIVIPKPADQFRIVCLGGSTTYSTGVKNYQLAYPYLLEKELKKSGYDNVRVINAGVGAWTSWESLINFELRVLELEPDMIIIYHSINDILARFVWPPEAYKSDNSGRTSPISMSMPSILEHSTLLRYLMIRLDIVLPHSNIERNIDKPPDTYYGTMFYNQKVKDAYPSGIFKKITAKQILATNNPKYFKRNIENIVLTASHRGIKTIVATFAYSPLFTDEPVVSSKEYISAYEEMNEVLKSIASEMRVNLFDFAKVFPTDKDCYTDGIHVNAEGSQLKAKLFADYIIENKLLPNQ